MMGGVLTDGKKTFAVVRYHSSAALLLFFTVHKETTETHGEDAGRPKVIITVEGVVIYNNRGR